MKAALLMLVFATACGSNDGTPADARPDGAGSGSGAEMALEVTPHDTHLELMVVALGMVIVLGPVLGSKRRAGG